MTEQYDGAERSAFDKLRERYQQEQQKRIRTDGMAQWRELGEELDEDPFVEPGFTRDPLAQDTTVLIVGGGFAGMLTASGIRVSIRSAPEFIPGRMRGSALSSLA